MGEQNINLASANAAQGFRSAMFGFKKDEVLNYIEKLSGENLAKQQELAGQIEQLEAKARVLEENQDLILEKTKEICGQLEQEQEKCKKLLEEQDAIQEETRVFKGKAMAREQELILSQSEKRRLQEKVDELTSELECAKSQENEIGAALIGAQRAAARIMESANIQAVEQKQRLVLGATEVGVTVGTLKVQLAEVEERIDLAFAAMKHAADEIGAAVERVDMQLSQLGAQAEAVSEKKKPMSPPLCKSSAAPHKKTLQEMLLEKLNRLLGE